ncbi:TetR/AcrR family transcriptional regulator [Nocardia yunnanensis]|uniref:TetR/AcrR family transcriptional regulator n=1 Tax=Nocardia yunnanensis TaxID=2382165 RepID=A0A386ZAY1_9NOCA|nr:TetR/AcrR family transcriptional regulator [Nocardia yunnanensis]AYF75002.1 TetR/AcrR family transcriptional regulator [Nocardia yunnanensis]
MGRPRNFEADTVVDRAMEAFWTHGYAGCSPAQLAAATGIGKGSLYNTFGSKRELFDLAMARYNRMGSELAREVLAEPGSTRERFRAWMRFTVDTEFEHPVRRGCLLVNTALELGGHDAEAAKAVNEGYEYMIEVFAERLEQGRRDGDVRADLDPRGYAEFLMNTIGGLRITAKVSEADAMYRIIDTALSTL